MGLCGSASAADKANGQNGRAFLNVGPSVISDEAQGLLHRSRPALQSLFDTYSSKNLVTLEQFFGLCEDFDLYPTFITRAGVEKCFGKVAGSVSLYYVIFGGFWGVQYDSICECL